MAYTYLLSGRLAECEALRRRFSDNGLDIAAAEVDEVFLDVPLVQTEGHIMVLQNGPVFFPVVVDEAEAELLVKTNGLVEVLYLQTRVEFA